MFTGEQVGLMTSQAASKVTKAFKSPAAMAVAHRYNTRVPTQEYKQTEFLNIRNTIPCLDNSSYLVNIHGSADPFDILGEMRIPKIRNRDNKYPRTRPNPRSK